MDGPEPPLAWQPVTAAGVAAFARASLGRLLLVQLIVALLAASVSAWSLHRAWFPVITDAIEQLPAQGQIRDGRLDWGGEGAEWLSEGPYLAVAVDPDHEGDVRSPAHVEIEFGRRDVRFISLFGFVPYSYPQGRTIPFNQNQLGPWWGAWAPPLLAITMAVVVVGLLLLWSLQATFYCLPVWLACFLAIRDVSLRGSWRLAGAALMPGALFLIAALLCYGLGVLDLLQLTSAAALHVVVGWAYLMAAPFRLPRHPEATTKGNPFDAPENVSDRAP